jgi:hypothetical protein
MEISLLTQQYTITKGIEEIIFKNLIYKLEGCSNEISLFPRLGTAASRKNCCNFNKELRSSEKSKSEKLVKIFDPLFLTTLISLKGNHLCQYSFCVLCFMFFRTIILPLLT